MGEKILIMFKNKARHPFSITAHGVQTFGPSLAVQSGKSVKKKNNNNSIKFIWLVIAR